MHDRAPRPAADGFTRNEAKACTLGIILLAAAVWALDVVAIPKERVVHSVACTGRSWVGLHCSGQLVAAERYAFLPSVDRQEVIYWIVDSTAPSAKFVECLVRDSNNWACRDRSREPPPIPHAMVRGQPVASDDNAESTIRGVTKWKWWALHLGFRGLSRADY